MMNVTDSEQRKNNILEAIIEAYVNTASPIGSELIAKIMHQSLSPATIRNVMVELEESGLVEQPHISAGRVPTDRGYRHYVDSVMDVRRLPPEQLRQIESLIQPAEMDLRQLLERAIAALSDMTQQAAFAVAPTVKRSTVKQIELVPLSVRRVLCVLVANDEIIASHVVETVEPMTRDEAMALVRFLNTELAGLSFGDLLESLGRRMLAENDSFYHLVKRSLDILQHALSTEPDERFLLEGASHVVSQPEFSANPRKTHELLKGLDEHEALVERIRQDLSAEGVRVRIGHELRVPGFDDCSYLAAPVVIGHDIVGGIGVLGPTRMDYRRMRSSVDAMSRCVTEWLTRWETR